MKYGTGRDDRDDATLGSAPLASALEAPSDAPFLPLQFDPREFMEFVEDENLTEAEATELLRAIWEIVVALVDLRFGISPIQHLVDRSGGSGGSTPAPAVAVVSSPSFKNTFNKQTSGRDSRTMGAKEDS